MASGDLVCISQMRPIGDFMHKKTSIPGSSLALACLLLALPVIAAAKTPPKAAPPAPAASPPPEPKDFTNMELEQLMSMEVTGVTRRAGSYAKSPAAVFVLTGEDIRRSGARTIAEALRLVPGVQVYRTNAQNYTVTARGFGGDKLQVLLDGRSVYTPLTSTVFWDVLDTYFEDIARIEVIRGPGATVWGANAVNGVINIITRPAADSAGTHVFGGGGNEDKSFGGFRTGGKIGTAANGRAYVKARERDSTERADGSDVTDGQTHVQAGARVDTDLGAWGTLVGSGDIYQSGEYSATFPAGTTSDTTAAGRNVSLQWTYGWSGGASTQTSLYYDGYDRTIPTIFGESRDTYDLNVQHNLGAMHDNLLTFGGGARLSADETAGTPSALIVFDPQDRTTQNYNVFVQDEWAITDDLWLLGGVKLEDNDFTGFEYEPGVRLGWSIADGYYTWAAVSRAVRTPNRIDHDTAIACFGANNPIPGCPGAGGSVAIGSKDFESEKLIAYEWGLRSQLIPTLLTDVALFYNDYKDLRSTESATRFANGIQATGYGGELSVSWELATWCSLQAFYAYLKIDAERDSSSTDSTTVNNLEGGSPQQSAGLRVGLQPWSWLDVDTFTRFVDSLPASSVPNYVESDVRVGWHVTPLLELAIAGQNLLDAAHPESGANTATRSEIARSVFGELTWRWK
jgi:iron complex outermembrane recepter protein